MSFHCLLPSRVSEEKSVINLSEESLYVTSCFSLTASSPTEANVIYIVAALGKDNLLTSFDVSATQVFLTLLSSWSIFFKEGIQGN